MKRNTNFGRLLNSILIYAPYAGMYQGKWYCPYSDEQLLDLNWKPLIRTDYPTDGNTYKEEWVDGETSIIQTWICTHVKDNEEKRQEAYASRKVVEYDDATYTINEANQLYLELIAELANVKAAALGAKIKIEKNKIREEYPV